MKEKIKKIGLPKFILIITTLLVIFFSVFILFKIARLNNSIYNDCEPRKYVDWAKQEKIPITVDEKKELENANQECDLYQKYLHDNNIKNFISLYDSTDKYIPLTQMPLKIQKSFRICVNAGDKEKILETLKNGYVIKSVPDEERREKSRQEVRDYENCLRNQEVALKSRPQAYNFLFIGNALILVAGVLIAFSLNKSKKD